MSFNTKDTDKQIPEPLSPDDIPLIDGELNLLKEKPTKRKSQTKNRTAKSKKTKTTIEYISESDSGSDSSIDDYERNILNEMEYGRAVSTPQSNVAPYEFSAMMENERFALERGLPILRPAIPPLPSEHALGPHPNSLDPYHKISRFFNSIQLLYNEAEDCFYVEWEGANIFASTPVLSYKRIYVIDYYFHIVGDILNGNSKSYIISGPSGIGKSQMILFIVAYLRTLPIEVRPAVYIKNNQHEYTLYIEEQVYVVEKEENIRAVIEIIDSVGNYNKLLPQYGKRIEITNGNTLSPSLSSSSIFSNSVVYYLPRWSKNDVIKCLKIIPTPPATPSLNWNDNINNIFEKIGGIIKYIIISTALNYDIEKEINESIDNCRKNNLPIFYLYNESCDNNNNNNVIDKYADKTGLLYEDLIDDNYHIYGRCIYSDNTMYLLKNPGVKDFYNLFRRFMKLQNWKENIFLLLGFNTIINNNNSNNTSNNSLIKYEYHNKNEVFDNELPEWLMDSVTKDNIFPDMVFYSHYMVFNFRTDKKTYSMLFLYPEGIMTLKTFTSFDLIYYPSTLLNNNNNIFNNSNSQLKKDVKIIKYEYDKIIKEFPNLVTPFAVLNEEIAERQNSILRNLPIVESRSIKEEINNNNNYNRNTSFYLLSPSLIKTTYQTMQTLVLVENSIYYSYFEIIINNFEWQQALFNLCRIIYISPHIELKLILYYYMYKKGSAYLIALHCNNESGYIKTIYDVFGDGKQFISSFNTKMTSLRGIYPSLPSVMLIENVNQNDW